MLLAPAVDVRNDVRLSFLSWLAAAESEREEGYRTFREYYDGDHCTQLTARMRKFLQVTSGEDFRSNYCPIVVDALSERLAVTGFTCGEQAGVLWSWWIANKMDAVQGVVHTATIRDGDAYVLVDWDEDAGLPGLHFEPAYDGGEGVKVIYDDVTRRPKLASKRWRAETGSGAGSVRRLNVYFPDRVEKYVSDDSRFEGSWQPFCDVEGEEWPLPWVDSYGDPLGVPVVHFKNNDQGYNYGQSELKDIVPLQNALNKTIIDLLAAADTTAFRVYWMVGDDPSDVAVAPGSWVYTRRPPGGENGASIGYFPGEDLSNLISLKDSFAIEIARVSRTPVSYFQVSGQRPAEGTLKQEESGLVGKAVGRQVTFGNSWENALRLARRVYNTFSAGPVLDPTVPVSGIWRDPQTRNEQALYDSLKIKAELGVPREQLWVEMGYNSDDILRMKEMLDAEANIGERVLAKFERGGQEPAADAILR